MRRHFRTALYAAVPGILVGATLGLRSSRSESIDVDLTEIGVSYPPKLNWNPPKRSELWKAISSGEEFDLLVIGGGATGTGVAVDAASRGLKVALVEREDFGAGTSSRSTKLVHGGVRYLENAFKKLDYGQYLLVKEALHERFIYLRNAPHLTNALPIMLPLYNWWSVPYYWVGSHVYDLLSGRERLASSYYVSKQRALEVFPMLNAKKLKGAMVYYDGQTNDSRMNVALALTAVALGAVCLNHVEASSFLYNSNGNLEGAVVKDLISGNMTQVKAKCIVNATGPFADSIRKMDDPKAENIIVPSSGTHIVLPDYYSPQRMGLLDPATSDGRVIFFVPWEGATVAGTTDVPCVVEPLPKPSEAEVSFILSEIKSYLSPDVRVRRGDVSAAWTGIRPLVRDPSIKGTSQLSRSHLVLRSESGLITIAGGKWTTYRKMAEDTVDEAIRATPSIKPKGKCVTERLKVIGSHEWTPNLFIQAIQSYGIDLTVAQHLTDNFGDRIHQIVKLCKPTGRKWPVLGLPLAPGMAVTEAEVRYVIRDEYACTLTDVLARRLRLGFLDTTTTLEVAPKVAEIMQQELGWSDQRKAEEMIQFRKYLRTMGSNEAISRSEFNALEIVGLREFWDSMDSDKDGRVSLGQLLTQLEKLKIRHDPKMLAATFGVVLAKEKESGLSQSHQAETAIDFAGFLDFLFLARQGASSGEEIDAFAKSLVSIGKNIDRSGGGV